jgi:hypothetical protein
MMKEDTAHIHSAILHTHLHSQDVKRQMISALEEQYNGRVSSMLPVQRDAIYALFTRLNIEKIVPVEIFFETANHATGISDCFEDGDLQHLFKRAVAKIASDVFEKIQKLMGIKRYSKIHEEYIYDLLSAEAERMSIDFKKTVPVTQE